MDDRLPSLQHDVRQMLRFELCPSCGMTPYIYRTVGSLTQADLIVDLVGLPSAYVTDLPCCRGIVIVKMMSTSLDAAAEV